MLFFSYVYSFFFTMGFFSNLENLNINTISQVLSLAASAYCNTPELILWTCKTCTQNVSNITIIDENTRIIMAYDYSLKSHFISIRGSSDINNWISNIETRIIYPYFDSNIGVHCGLYYEYLVYKERLISYVQTLNRNDLLIITGHSSGSALTTFLAYDLITQGTVLYNNINLYTFGSPRIGNKEFVESFTSFNITYNRVTYKNDVVPHLPQELFGFLHIPHEIWFNSTSKYKLCHDRDIKEDDSCSNSCSPFSCTSVNDHLNYLGYAIGSDAC
jgi:hypothetical protein